MAVHAEYVSKARSLDRQLHHTPEGTQGPLESKLRSFGVVSDRRFLKPLPPTRQAAAGGHEETLAGLLLSAGVMMSVSLSDNEQ